LIVVAGTTTASAEANSGPAAASARARLPRLLTYEPGSTFFVRPPFMSFGESGMPGGTFNYNIGPGITVRQWMHGRRGKIRWSRWGATAVGRATGLTQECNSLRGGIVSCSEHYLAEPLELRAWRVRHGRYTRYVEILLSRYGNEPTYTYGLRRIRVRANGEPHGLLLWSWCAVNFRSACSHP
jgi:hypothetical protein